MISKKALITPFLKLKSHFSEPIPRSLKDFDSFFESICEIYDIPFLPSYRQAIATMIMHMPPQEDKCTKSYFAKAIRKAMSNEIAYSVIQKIKNDAKIKQEEEAKEADTLLEKQSAESKEPDLSLVPKT